MPDYGAAAASKNNPLSALFLSAGGLLCAEEAVNVAGIMAFAIGAPH
jgi:hypothetical protein